MADPNYTVPDSERSFIAVGYVEIRGPDAGLIRIEAAITEEFNERWPTGTHELALRRHARKLVISSPPSDADIAAHLPSHAEPKPIPIRIHCPECHELHVDEGEWATKPHHTHSCQACGHTWRPAVVHTVGVRFLPGFRNTPA